ncbi:penicillin acylase family protein [Denitrificimonas caeni]|uniref:penicillin acylase family protein n=1 Tax=Denitrificimonas caeni TaxID=521720 RepID=UPI00196382EC|nr:penicillin acylase family protein [Denitrificimonas caeni]
MPTFTLRHFSWLPSFSLPSFCGALVLGTLGSLSGCQLLESGPNSSVIADSGVVRLQGIVKSSQIAKNAAGMPLIEANNFHDLLFSLGYSHASDRLTQMVQLRLLAQGRLAEMHGTEMLNLDRLMRSINLRADAQNLYKNAPKNLQSFFEIYARGINAYIYQMRGALPPELAKANYQPEYWKAEDSALLFTLFSFSQSGNLSEEVLALAFAQNLTNKQLPWLLPVYPDEPLALNEAQQLQALPRSTLQNTALRQSTLQLVDTLNQFAAVNSLKAPLATSWATRGQHSVNRRSLLTLSTLQNKPATTPVLAESRAQTSPYSWVNLHSPQLQAAGLTIPGVPFIMSGFNGRLAYSISAVMADTQDVFIEQLRQNNSRLEYLIDKKWQPAQQRTETFFIRGQRPVRETLYSTAHGPLLTTLPVNNSGGYALALQHARLADDQSLNALWQLLRMKTVEQATQLVPTLRALPASVLLADAEHIAWQVTGLYPNRRNSRGLFPSAGWDSSVAWEGYADPMLHPYDQDPQQGWLSAANQRLTQPGYGMQLSSSWANPERAENLTLQLAKRPVSASFAIRNSAEQRPWLIGQLQSMLNAGGMPQALQQATQKLPAQQRTAAQQALKSFLALSAQQPLSQNNAAWLERFLAQVEEQLFKAELQALPSSMQQAFALHNQYSYPAWLDHLLGRDDSPFWPSVASSKAQFLLDNLLSSRQAISAQVLKGQTIKSQTMLVDFSRPIPLSAVSFSGQADNPQSPYYQLKAGVAGQLYPLPVSYKDIISVYGKQRLTLLPAL